MHNKSILGGVALLWYVCLMLDREGPPKSRVKKCICISSQSATLRTIKYKNVYVYGVTCHRIQVFSKVCIYCPNQENSGELNCKLSFKSANNYNHDRFSTVAEGLKKSSGHKGVNSSGHLG